MNIGMIFLLTSTFVFGPVHAPSFWGEEQVAKPPGGRASEYYDGFFHNQEERMLWSVWKWLGRKGDWESEASMVFQYWRDLSQEAEQFNEFLNHEAEKEGGETGGAGVEFVPDLHQPGAWSEKRPPSEETKAEWLREAQSGQATSISPPHEITPPCKMNFFNVDDGNTPQKVPQPIHKVQLTANKRMQQQLKKLEKNRKSQPGDGGRDDVVPPTDGVPAKEAKTSAREKISGVDQPESFEKKLPKKTIAKRSNAGGPMQEAMAKFFEKKKAHGMSHREAQQAWLVSKARSRIIAAMPSPERRKRRFA